MQPYIGLTGFISSEEIMQLYDIVPVDCSYKLMCGVLLSNDRIENKEVNISKRYPKIENIKDIFIDDNRLLNIIHYKLPDNSESNHCKYMCNATQIGGKYCDGLQINGYWPTISALQKYKIFYPQNRIILQINKNMLQSLEPYHWAENCHIYKDYITDVLLDESGGLGIPLNNRLLMQYINAIRNKCPDLGIGVAGGLNSITLELVSDIFYKYDNISIDAESGLRDINDNISENLCIMYMDKAFEILNC